MAKVVVLVEQPRAERRRSLSEARFVACATAQAKSQSSVVPWAMPVQYTVDFRFGDTDLKKRDAT